MIYRGWGFIALLIPIVTILLFTYLFGVDGNISLEVFLYSLLASGPIVFFLGIWMNRKSRQICGLFHYTNLSSVRDVKKHTKVKF